MTSSDNARTKSSRLRGLHNAVQYASHLKIPTPFPLSRSALTALVDKLPAFPSCAAEVLRAAQRGRITTEDLIHLASHDQVLAGGLVQAANGAKYTWSGKVQNLEQAVGYLGEVRATQMLVEAAMKPILAIIGHRRLWEHSLEAAAVAQRLAASSGLLKPSDAYLLGLVHDVGALLLSLAPADARAGVQALIAAGCETPVAELLLLGTTHAQAGADVLRYWGMPGDYVKAVEHHHDPEVAGGPGAALLYLAEQWTEPDGDRLRDDRLAYSLAALHLHEEKLYEPVPDCDRQGRASLAPSQ